MRTLGIFAITFLLLVSAVPAMAQTPPATVPVDNTVIVPDGTDDVYLQAASRVGGPTDNASKDANNNYDHLDIHRIVVGQESASDFVVSLFMKTLTVSSAPGTPVWTVSFSDGAKGWRIYYGPCTNRQSSAKPTACLQSLENGRSGYRTVKAIAVDENAQSKAYVFTISKQDVFNQNHVTIRYGDQLANLSALASQSTSFGGGFGGQGGGGDPTGGVTAFDRAPNDGSGPLFTFLHGSKNHGHLSLYCADPIRVSNGEATTIVYKVVVANDAANLLGVQLEPKGLPDGWSARAPGLVNVPAKSNVTVAVILSVPFTHEHGKTFTFTLGAVSSDDPNSGGEVELGVFWTEVPQPSAHHKGMQWFHAAPADNPQLPDQVEAQIPTMASWMNGIETDPDPNAKNDDVPGFSQNNAPGPGGGGGNPTGITQQNVTWFFPLSPELQIGLDFDLARQVQFVFDLVPGTASNSARIVARLHYCNPQQQTSNQGGGGGGGGGNQGGSSVCATNAPIIAQSSKMQSLGTQQPAHFEMSMNVNPTYDLIPYRHGANIAISVSLYTEVPQNVAGTQPRPVFREKNAVLTLPLIEYHDPVEQALQNVGSLSMASESPFEKQVNPGKATLFKFDLTASPDAIRQKVSLEVQGINADWAHLIGPEVLDMKPGDARNLTLVVKVPADAAAEERAELFFVAQSLKDPTVMTAVRLRATVNTTATIPDEAAEAAQLGSAKTSSPGFEPLALVAAVGVGMALWRGRRKGD